MAKKEVLDFKPAPRPEQVGDKRPKQLKEWITYTIFRTFRIDGFF
jgi:hypothetical protein